MDLDAIIERAVSERVAKALGVSQQSRHCPNNRVRTPVIVCTDKRGVVFGYCGDVDARPIVLTSARMCLYWDAKVGGVFGLGEVGPNANCKISATLENITLEGVTAVLSVSDIAEKAWSSAKVQGR